MITPKITKIDPGSLAAARGIFTTSEQILNMFGTFDNYKFSTKTPGVIPDARRSTRYALHTGMAKIVVTPMLFLTVKQLYYN